MNTEEKPLYIQQNPWHVELYGLGGISLGRLPREVAISILHDEIKRREAEWQAKRKAA